MSSSGKEDFGDNGVSPKTKIKSVNSSQLGFFRRIMESVKNLDFYGLVFFEGGKRAVFYCLKLCLLVGLITGIIFGLSKWSLASRVSTQLQEQIPTISFQNGDVSTEKETPYRMDVLDNYEIILDPDATLNRLRLDDSVLMVLVDGAIYVRNSQDSFEAWSLSGYTTGNNNAKFTITAETLANWTSLFQWMILIMSCIGLMIGYVIQGFLHVGLISVGGMFALNKSDEKSKLFGWKQLLILSCYAITPVVILNGLLFSTGISLPYQEFLLLGGGTVFMYFITDNLVDKLKGMKVEITEVAENDESESEKSDDFFG